MSEHALIEEYRPVVSAIARRYFLAGGETADLEQEGMVGFLQAVRDFRPDRGASFKTFALLCIERQIITAIKNAQRLKHRPLTHAKRHAENDEGVRVDVVDLVADPGPSVVDIVAARERLARVTDRVRNVDLSALERRAFFGLVNGETYAEMAAALGVTTKSIDNAIARARRKLADPFVERLAA